MAKKEKVAVILFNLGGPDQLSSVKPFLFNLFYDPAIISVANPLRWMLAKFISFRRAPYARKIYEKIGGKSPLLPQSQDQAAALAEKLNQDQTKDYRCFVSMRYWHPFSTDVARNVKDFDPDRLILLPLYPQYSITTTGSSFIDWMKSAGKVGLEKPYQAIRDYESHPLFIQSHVSLIKENLAKIENPENYRILYSAHGLPKKIIEAGDPYQKQVEKTCALVQEELGNPDHMICYQSRVGPLEWIGPSTEEEIERAGRDGKSIIMVPIAFVSEHSETLVELDMDYRSLAEKNKVADYRRIKALGCEENYIAALADLCKMADLCENADKGGPDV